MNGDATSVAGSVLNDLLPSLFTLSRWFCAVAGLSLAGMSCYSAIKVSEGRSRTSWRGVAATLATGIVLLNLPALISTVGQTLLNDSADPTSSASALSYVSGISAFSSSAELTNGMAAAIYYTQFIGWVGAIRGWWMIRAAMTGTSQVSVGAGAVHVIAGVLAANVTKFTPYISQLLGLNTGG